MTKRPSKSILAGLVGAGIGESKTPAMHEAEGAAQGLAYVYRQIDMDVLGVDVSGLEGLLSSAQQLGYTGLNITYPAKQAIVPLLDELSSEASAIGAVNTVVLADGRRVGHNTDCLGFAEGFKRGLPGVPRRRVVQMGAGGAGSAVATALLMEGVEELVVVDTELDRAEGLVERLNAHFGGDSVSAGTNSTEGHAQQANGEPNGNHEPTNSVRPRASAVAFDNEVLHDLLASADGLVNTTPVGMAKLPGMPVPASALHSGLWVAEIIYFPIETELLRTARAKGCRTLDGGRMAVFQAVKAFELFSGVVPDEQRMSAHFASFYE